MRFNTLVKDLLQEKEYIAFHGSKSGEFSAFKKTDATFFTDNEYVARSYMNSWGEKSAQLHKVRLTLNNPLRYDAKGKSFNELSFLTNSVERLINKAKENGNDGVIIKNIYDAPNGSTKDPANLGTNYIVFDPSQVRVEDK